MPAKLVSLLYHDVVPGEDFERSGLREFGADRFKIEEQTFRAHLSAVLDETGAQPARADELDGRTEHDRMLLLTFDDGGISALRTAELLEDFGCYGHFFVTTNFVGRKGFLSPPAIVELRDRGHLIGSHSHTHPTRMSALGLDELATEWRRSRHRLESILDEEIRVASLPGGYYSRRVGRAARDAGFEVLFTSEPCESVSRIGNTRILGRYSVDRRTPVNEVVSLVQGKLGARARRYFWWQFKKIAKNLAGRRYLQIRKELLSRIDGPSNRRIHSSRSDSRGPAGRDRGRDRDTGTP